MVEGCSGQTGQLSGVRWFASPSGTQLTVHGAEVDAYWDSGSNTIVVNDAVKLTGSLIRHEMLHSITRSPAHLRSAFLERCGGVVVCIDSCITDAGPLTPPDASVPRVPPDSVEIFSSVHPPTPTSADTDGFFTLTVSARNPMNHPIVVLLPPSGDAGPSLSFSYKIIGDGGEIEYNVRAWDPEVTYFAAGETKREVFDMVVRPIDDMPFAILPGTYQILGAYGERPEAAWTLTIRP
jgi:hypothetical protein